VHLTRRTRKRPTPLHYRAGGDHPENQPVKLSPYADEPALAARRDRIATEAPS
jgi:hypothetical protein